MEAGGPSAWRLEVGLQGFLRALARLEAVEHDPDGTSAVVATIECVMWLTTTVELMAPTRADIPQLGLSDIELDLVGGLRWARNQGVHRLVSSVEAADGSIYDRSYPRQYWHWAWVERTEIEQRHDLRDDPVNGRAYDNALAGRPAIPILREAGDVVAKAVLAQDRRSARAT